MAFAPSSTSFIAGIDEGAKLETGGVGRPDGLDSGYFVKPTIFSNVSNDMTIAREEIFGPVLVLIPYEDDDEAPRVGRVYARFAVCAHAGCAVRMPPALVHFHEVLCAVGAAAFVPAPIPAAGLQRRPLAAFRCGMLVHQASCTTARAIKGTPRE